MEAETDRAVSVHAGHRQRMLETYLNTGLDGFSDVEALEFLLFYAIPRRDVNELAHALLREFGSLYRVFEMPVAQLARVDGVGLRTAALLRLVFELRGRCDRSREEGKLVLRSIGEIGSYLMNRAAGLREERAWLLCMDASRRVIECRELCRGAVNSVNLPYRKLVEAALLANASVVVLGHNHTAGLLMPSLEDMDYTRGARRALALVDVVLFDHIILGATDFLSMRSSNMLLE